MMGSAGGAVCRGMKRGRFAGLHRIATLLISRDHGLLPGVDLSVSRLVLRSASRAGGRHAIQRAGSSQEAARLRHAQRILPRGVHRTRMSEVRGVWVRAAGLPPQRHPIRSAERIRP